VRGELNGGNVEGCVRVAVLTRDGGDGGAAIGFAEGEAVAVLRMVSGGSAGGGESSWGHRSGAREDRAWRWQKSGWRLRRYPFKGGRRVHSGGGGESGDVWRAERRGGRGPERDVKWLGWLASVPVRHARAVALPHDSGGRWDAGDTGARG
jgi:hypothetical protein